MSEPERTADWSVAEPGTAAERATLGGMLLSRTAVADALDVVRASDFLSPGHALIFDAILSLYSHGEPTDVLAVVDELVKTSQLVSAGGAHTVHALTSFVTTPVSTGFYATLVRDAAALRLVGRTGAALTRAALSGQVDASDVLWWAADQIHEAETRMRSDDSVPFEGAFDMAVEMLEAARGHDASSIEVGTGISELDELTGGLRPGELVVIGGETAAGKSTLLLDILRHVAMAQHRPCALFSLELSRGEVATRMMSAMSDVPLHDIRRGALDTRAWTAIAGCRARVQKSPLHINDRTSGSIHDIRLASRQLLHRGGLKMVAVDHMQLLPGDRVSRELKLLARELRVPVVAVSQFTGGQLPEDVAQDADLVLLVSEHEVTVAKHRHGPVATIDVERQGQFSRFVSRAPDTDSKDRTRSATTRRSPQSSR